MTIATRHQYLQCLHNLNNNFLIEDNVTFPNKHISKPVSELNDNHRAQVWKIVHPHFYESIPIAKRVEFNGINYEMGNVVITKYDSDYEFGVIENITYLNGCIWLIIRCTDVTEFNTHIHSYILDVREGKLILKISNLLSLQSLPAYRSETNELIVRLLHFVCSS